jgi:ribosomal protein S18 acetylase RimI-like enzyme
MTDLLDNVVWHSIDGPRRALAERHGLAGRFDPEVSPFSAVADPASPAAWADLATLVGSGRRSVLFLPEVDLPGGWVEDDRVPCLQLVAEHVTTTSDDEGLIELGPADADDMLALVAATKPGPFAKRTVELGGYLGVRDDAGRLVTMAGERLRVDGFTEVSAVCTIAELRGTGMGTRLVLAVVDRIRARGEQAFLHVADTNTNAIRLYLALGFTERCRMNALIVKSPT